MNKNILVLVFLVFDVFFILFAMEALMHSYYYQKATSVSEFAIKTAENAGGFTPAVIEKVKYRMDQEGLDSNSFKVTATTKEKVNFGEELNVNIQGSFTYHTISLLGTGTGNIEKKISSPNIGYSNVWFR